MDLHPLREYRQKHALTQKELAIILNTSHASISRIEARKQKIDPNEAIVISEKLNNEVHYLELLYPDNGNKFKTYPISRIVKQLKKWCRL